MSSRWCGRGLVTRIGCLGDSRPDRGSGLLPGCRLNPVRGRGEFPPCRGCRGLRLWACGRLLLNQREGREQEATAGQAAGGLRRQRMDIPDGGVVIHVEKLAELPMLLTRVGESHPQILLVEARTARELDLVWTAAG